LLDFYRSFLVYTEHAAASALEPCCLAHLVFVVSVVCLQHHCLGYCRDVWCGKTRLVWFRSIAIHRWLLVRTTTKTLDRAVDRTDGNAAVVNHCVSQPAWTTMTKRSEQNRI